MNSRLGLCSPQHSNLPRFVSLFSAEISAETMELHHSKHHNTYVCFPIRCIVVVVMRRVSHLCAFLFLKVTNLNVALEKLDAAVSSGDVSGIIALQGALKFNGGGHLNHSLFWENLAPGGGELKDGPLKALILECYGDFDVMKDDLNAVTVAVQGSGWGWVGYNPKSGGIESKTCANQDPLQATTGLVPLMGIDVWEHAYYVDYRNLRPKYVQAIWNIINWDAVEKRLVAAQATS